MDTQKPCRGSHKLGVQPKDLTFSPSPTKHDSHSDFFYPYYRLLYLALNFERADDMSPPTNYGRCQIREGPALLRDFCPRPGFFWTWPKIVARPAQLRKKHCPCILEGRLTTNPILSALHLQGLKSNIYVQFPQVNKPLIRKWNHRWRT
jgi:hypothetical protein